MSDPKATLKPRCRFLGWTQFFAMAAFVAASLISSGVLCAQTDWSQWRGPQQNGVAQKTVQGDGFPIRWSENQNVIWKLSIDGRGSSTPVVAGDTAYLTSGIAGRNSLIAISVADGKVRWTTSLGEDRGGKHKKGSGSNPSAVVRDGLIYAYFRSGDLGCVDEGGNVVWETNLQDRFGDDSLWWDLGSSPLLTPDAVIVVVMQTGDSYLAAFDLKTGDLLWKEDRNLEAPSEAAQSYTTPLLVDVAGRKMIAVMGADHLTLHEASDGKLIGKLGGFNPTNHQYFRSISSPVASGKIIVCPYARGQTITAVDMDKLANGAGKNSIVWSRDDLGSDVPTPANAGDLVLIVGDGKQSRGIITCVDLSNGKEKWKVATPKSRIGFSSSPLVAGDHLYVTAENGTTHVIGPINSSDATLVSSNELADDEPFTTASPIPVGNSLLIRTKNSLYRIGN